MTSGFFSRLTNLSEVIPDDEEAPSIFNTGLFSFGQAQATTEGRGSGSNNNTTTTTGPQQTSSGGHAFVASTTGPPSFAAGSGGSSPHAGVGGARSEEEVRMLNRRVADLTKKLAEKTQQYKDLMDEATTVKAEFDAYRRKSEAQMRQERQLAQEDKRRLEELRLVGGSAGKVDEVYISGLKEKMHEMEARLREAATETQKAVKRQREAEEMRKQLEKEKKDEVAELVARYEQLLERAQQRQEQLEAQLTEDRARWSTRESDGTEAGSKKGEVAAMATEADAAAAAAAAPVGGEEATIASSAEEEEEATESAQTLALLQKQVAQLRGRAKELERAATLSEERARRQLDEALSDVVETQKRLTEKTSELDELKSLYAELQSTLATKEDDHAAREKDLRYQVRQLEDAVTRGKRERQELAEEAEKHRLAYEQAIQDEKERASLTSQRVNEAETASREVASTLEAQKAHYTAMLDARDATIAELSAIRRGLEQDLVELRADNRQETDRVEQLQREMAQQALLIKDLEAKQMHSQRFLALREEELQSRELERQRMRALLREEEDAHATARQELEEVRAKAADLEVSVRELESALQAAQEEGSYRDASTVQRAAMCEELEQALAEKEAVLAPLSERVATLQTTNFQLREELSTAMRRLEDAQQRLQRGVGSAGDNEGGEGSGAGGDTAHAKPYGGASARLSVLAGVGGGGGGHPVRGKQHGASADPASEGFTYTLPPSSREQQRFVQDAWQSARRFTAQARSQRYKLIFGVAAVLVVVFMVLSGFLTASSASTGDVARDMAERLRRAERRLDMCLSNCPQHFGPANAAAAAARESRSPG